MGLRRFFGFAQIGYPDGESLDAIPWTPVPGATQLTRLCRMLSPNSSSRRDASTMTGSEKPTWIWISPLAAMRRQIPGNAWGASRPNIVWPVVGDFKWRPKRDEPAECAVDHCFASAPGTSKTDPPEKGMRSRALPLQTVPDSSS
jgi:hypothetical protein